MTDWRPIETAPKEYGDEILVARLDDDGGYWCSVASWWIDRWAIIAQGDPKYRQTPWPLGFEPTHWQPLPEPPE